MSSQLDHVTCDLVIRKSVVFSSPHRVMLMKPGPDGRARHCGHHWAQIRASYRVQCPPSTGIPRQEHFVEPAGHLDVLSVRPIEPLRLPHDLFRRNRSEPLGIAEILESANCESGFELQETNMRSHLRLGHRTLAEVLGFRPGPGTRFVDHH